MRVMKKEDVHKGDLDQDQLEEEKKLIHYIDCSRLSVLSRIEAALELADKKDVVTYLMLDAKNDLEGMGQYLEKQMSLRQEATKKEVCNVLRETTYADTGLSLLSHISWFLDMANKCFNEIHRDDELKVDFGKHKKFNVAVTQLNDLYVLVKNFEVATDLDKDRVFSMLNQISHLTNKTRLSIKTMTGDLGPFGGFIRAQENLDDLGKFIELCLSKVHADRVKDGEVE